MRIDLYLFETGLARSRTEAKSMILSGAVTVNGVAVNKPSFEVENGADIQISRDDFEYVSRGGKKLKAALDAFPVNPEGRICLDVGASSGGFTDCLLQHGACHVFAVDSGTMQLVESLRLDERVSVMENFNARYMKSADFSREISLAVMDVSFISATYIIPCVFDVLTKGSDFICLIKPQFEVGKSGLSKGGIVKDERLQREAVKKVTEFAQNIGFKLEGCITSPIKGGDGNTEFLAYFTKA